MLNKIEILIFCLGFGLRFIYALIIQFLLGTQAFTAYSDAETFLTVAGNMLTHGVMSQMVEGPFVPDSLRTPLYPLFLAFFLWLKTPLLGIVIVQNVFAGLSGVFIYRIGKILFKSGSVGIVAAFLFIFEPVSIYWNNLLMSDNLFSFLLLFAIYLFIAGKLYSFAVILGLAVLTRPIGLYFFPLFLLAFIFQHYRSFGVVWKQLLLFCLLFLLILSPWALRNKILFNTWELSSAGWLNLYIFTFAQFTEQHQLILPRPTMPMDYPGQNQIVFSYDFINTPFYKSNILKIISEHPWEYLKFHLGYVVKTFNYHGYDYLINDVTRMKIPLVGAKLGLWMVQIGQKFWWILYALAAVGLCKKEYRLAALFLLVFVVWNNFLLVANGLNQGGRYSLPVMPMMLLLASSGAVALFNMLRIHLLPLKFLFLRCKA